MCQIAVYLGVCQYKYFQSNLFDLRPELGEPHNRISIARSSSCLCWIVQGLSQHGSPTLLVYACSQRAVWEDVCNMDYNDLRPLPHLRKEPTRACHLWWVEIAPR